MIRALALTLLLAAPAAAQDPTASSPAAPCGEGPRADAIMEPWDQNTATYANGAVRIAVLDFIEPAAVPFKLLVLTPPADEIGARHCRIVELPGGHGFSAIDFAARNASYNPATGLVIDMPVRIALPDDAPEDGWVQIYIAINQQTGTVSTQFFQ